jgi:PAS domain S-box-containing protein
MARAKAAEGLFSGLLESAPDAIVGVNAAGEIILVNTQTERIFGYTRAEVLGQPIEMLFPECVGATHVCYRAGYFANPRTRPIGRMSFDLTGRRKDGSEFPAGISLSALKTKDGLIVTSIIRDITEGKRLYEAARQAQVAAEAANSMKDEFLATVSHELRTPLQAILGWTRLLICGGLDAARTARALQTIERNVGAQAQLIEDILDVSRIIAGRLNLGAGQVHLQPIVEAAVEAVQASADAKRIRIDTVFAPDAPPVTGDANRLQQVVSNLLSNAVKFTPGGGLVRVRCGHDEASTWVKVQDAGRGIAPAFLPHVFDRFSQADSSSTRAQDGLGLGLTIVRHLVELHGGTVRAKSPGEGHGATFTVTLPLIKGGRRVSGPVPVEDKAMTVQRFDGLHMLVVDDTPDTLELVGTVLEQSGVRVTRAASVAEALRALAREQPDVLISDIAMPGRDGYSLIRRTRALEARGHHLPAIALTAYADVDHRERALRAGYDRHLAKPVEPNELLEAVAALVERHVA